MTELESYLMDKEAEASGTHVMPNSVSPKLDKDANPARTVRKVAGDAESTALTKNEGQSGEQVQKLPQAAPFKLDVATTDKGESASTQVKQATHYALPAFQRYPLDNYVQVVKAASYFDENYRQMDPSLRREYCVNLVKRASDLGISVSGEAFHYGGADYATDAHVAASLEMRRGCIKEAELRLGLDYLMNTRAEMRADDFAVALGEFDKVAGLTEYYDKDVPDPYWSTFGEKTAKESGAFLVGNDYISYDDLRRFAKTGAWKLADTFGSDFVDEFQKDPVAITKSLPVDQKKMVIRTASQSLTDPTTT